MASVSDRTIKFIRAVFNSAPDERENAHKPLGRAKNDGAVPSPFSAFGDRNLAEYLRVNQDLQTRLLDYEIMLDYPEIGAAVEIVTDDATQPDSISGRTVEVRSDDHEVTDLLEECFYDRLAIDEQIWPMTYETVSMGNGYTEILLGPDGRGVIGLQFMSPMATRRIETYLNGFQGFLCDPTGAFSVPMESLSQQLLNKDEKSRATLSKSLPAGCEVFEPWQVVHMRLQSRSRGNAYGFCLVGDSRVWTTEGLKPIRDVKVGDRVFTRHTGLLRTTPVIDHVSNGVKPVLKLKTKHRTLRATREHPVLVALDGQEIWKQVGELKPGDLVVGCPGFPGTLVPNGADFHLEEVISIEPDSAEEVFDIAVADKEHNFVAEGLVVHNSWHDPARWIYRRLVLLEESMMIYRLTRSISRYAFYVDMGKSSPREVSRKLNEAKMRFKKKKIIDPTTGQIDQRYNVLDMTEDFWVPIINGQDSTRIDVIGGPTSQTVEDVEIFARKLYAALKVPKMYLGYSEDRAANSILSNTDVQFARSIMRVQREVRNGLKKICRVHLSALGIDPAATYFDVSLTIPSGVFEIAQMEIRNARADLASRLKEFYPTEWLLKEIFGHTDEEVQVIKQGKSAEEAGGASAGAAQLGQAGGGQLATSMNHENREFQRLTTKSLKELRTNVAKVLEEDKQLKNRLKTANTLLEELRHASEAKAYTQPSIRRRG